MPRLPMKGTRAMRTAMSGKSRTPPSSGRAIVAPTVTRPEGEQRCHRPQAGRVVVVAGNHDHRRDLGKVEKRPVDDLFGCRRRGGRVEDVAGDEDEVDLLVAGDGGDLRQDLAMLVVTGTTADRPAHMPIGGMEKFQLVLTSREAGKRVLRLATRHRQRLRGPGCPGREGELENQRHGQLGLGQQHRARFENGGSLALHRRKKPVFLPRGLGGVEPTHHPDRAVGDDAALDLAGGLLGSDEDDAEAATTFGDIEKDLLDRAVSLPRGVLVEFVEDQEEKLGRLPGTLLVVEGSLRMVTPTANRLARSWRL